MHNPITAAGRAVKGLFNWGSMDGEMPGVNWFTPAAVVLTPIALVVGAVTGLATKKTDPPPFSKP
jgi:hypothetical protein